MTDKVFKLTLTDPLSPAEIEWLVMQSEEADFDVAVNQSGRIVLLEGPQTIEELIKFLSEHEFAFDIGLIEETIQYEPIYDTPHYEVEFDDYN